MIFFKQLPNALNFGMFHSFASELTKTHSLVDPIQYLKVPEFIMEVHERLSSE